MDRSRIAELAGIISANTAEIDAYIAARGLPSPSFDADSPPELLLCAEVAELRQRILDATDELHALMLGPVGVLTPSHTFFTSLQGICRFGLAASVPLDSKRLTFAQLSSLSGLGEGLVKRIVRHAAAYHIFQEPVEGFIEHTAASRMLATNPRMRQWVLMVAEEMLPAAAKTIDALIRWPNSEDPVHTVGFGPGFLHTLEGFLLIAKFQGYNLAHQTSLTMFDEISRHPVRAQRYAEAMMWFNTGPGLEPSHVLDVYPWDAIGEGTVVDVGGGYGAFSIALAERFTSIRCIVQDRKEVVEEAQGKIPSNIKGRVLFHEHDFFKDQPGLEIDVFFLRWILHDWSDAYAVRILKALIPALKPGSRVLVNENIVPQHGTVSFYKEKSIRGFDMSMLEIHNGKERGMGDWVKVFGDADRRFKIIGVKRPPSSKLSLLEVKWDPDS